MNNARVREWHRSQSGAIYLGNELPLFVDGGSRSDFDRSRVSVRWLSGTILTGLCGAMLMGGAVFAALGETHFAITAETIGATVRAGVRAVIRKSDRLPPVTEVNGA
ncbi:MAG: hypothetical protein J2P53_16105, partial [Bradyrhizobiaceae bacterium]|nr:hypothetical protein [Bradyrhizobiaceae bacterium]